jgi:twitching motility protein PilU
VRLRIKHAQGGDAHTLSQGLEGVEIDKANDKSTFGGMLSR